MSLLLERNPICCCCRLRPAANTNRSANPNAESMLCNLTHSNSASVPSTTSTVDARATALCATDGKRRLLSVGTRGANAVSRAASNCCANVSPGCLLPVEPAAPVAGAAVAAASDLACAKCAVRDWNETQFCDQVRMRRCWLFCTHKHTRICGG